MATLGIPSNYLDQNKILATLGMQGWVTDIGKQIDMSIAYTFVSNASQTHFFPGKIVSMQKIIQENSGNISSTCSAMQIALENYLKGIFDDATVSVTSDKGKALGRSIALFVRAEVVVKDKTYNTSAGIELTDSRIAKFFNLNDTQPAY